MDSKTVVIFGAGSFGSMALDYYGYENVLCFVDNNEKRIGKNFRGKPIISSKNLIDIGEKYRVIVAANAYGQIAEQLKKMGINKFGLYLPQYTNTMDRIALTKELEEKNVMLFGMDESTEILLEDLLNRQIHMNSLVLADKIDSPFIGKEYAGYKVEKFMGLDDVTDIIIVASQSRTYALRAYLNREIGNGIKIISPFIKSAYYDTEELIVNSYVRDVGDITEEEWNAAIVRNPNRIVVDEYIAELNRKLPLFEHIEIETINRCNGKCDFCPVSVIHDIRERHVMEEWLFQNIIDQLADLEYAGRLATFSNNEPFLDSRIIKFNCYAREKLPRARIHLFTNGTVMGIKAFTDIIDYLDELIIDNYNQKLELNDNSKAVKEYCDSHPELKKKVTIVLRKENEILTSRGGEAPNRMQKESYPLDKCVLPFKQLIVRADGKVSLCCNDPYGRMTLGDTRCESLTDIWYGKRFEAVREKLLHGRGMVEHCKYCDTFMLF